MFYRFLKDSNPADIHLFQPLAALVIEKLTYLQTPKCHILRKACQSSDRTGCFPLLPKLYERGQYAKDSKKESWCTKLGKKQKHLLPGVFLVHCPHGKSFRKNVFISLYVGQ